MKILWIFFGSFLCILGSFLKVKVQNRGFFLGRKNFKYFFRVLEIPDIFFGVNGRCWARAYRTYAEQMRGGGGGVCGWAGGVGGTTC